MTTMDTVSFNIFGSLLLRPYAMPSDVLSHLGYIHNIPGFAQRRQEAEGRARQKVPNGEATLEEMYKEL